MPHAATPAVDYYRLLALPPPPTPLTPSVVKKAYHRALLIHHPDKARNAAADANAAAAVSVDTLTAAYDTLRDPVRRAEYDLARSVQGAGKAETPVAAVVQVTDLEEFKEHDDGRWTLSCRCGETEGFEVREEELEEAVDAGEVLVGCVGCSLWRRVQFGVVEE